MGRVKVAKLPRCFSQCAEVILELCSVVQSRSSGSEFDDIMIYHFFQHYLTTFTFIQF